VLVLLALAAIGIHWDHNRRGHYFWQPAPVVETPAAETAPSATEAPAPAN
jgi:hypothetical protein